MELFCITVLLKAKVKLLVMNARLFNISMKTVKRYPESDCCCLRWVQASQSHCNGSEMTSLRSLWVKKQDCPVNSSKLVSTGHCGNQRTDVCLENVCETDVCWFVAGIQENFVI